MKKTMKKLLAFLMAFCLVVGIAMPDNKSQAASSTTKYDGGYGIDEILSQFQFFVSGDVSLNNSGHTVGSVAVGGTLDMSNSFGDAGIVPSYINKLKNGYLGTGWHGQVPIKSNVVYYGTSANTINDSNWYQNAGYIDMAAAFDEIKKQSAFLATMEDNKIVTLSNGSLVIDLTGVNEDTYVNISYADFKAANSIDIKAENADWFSKHICLINITGAGSGEVYYDGYSKVKIAGQSADTGLESMSGADAEFNKQLNFSGMNLIWNFPDATGTVKIQGGLGGHMVAPYAEVNFVSGNYEGGVIAREISGGAQGHFYPMSLGLPNATPVVTADATFSKKAVSANGDELAGASMKLTYVAGKNTLIDVEKAAGNNGADINKALDNKSISWTSNGNVLKLTSLPEGEYVLTETAAPAGYKYATEIAFKVVADGDEGKIYQKDANGNYLTTPTTTLTMVDEAKSGSAVIKGTKRVVGQPASAETYTFKLYADDKTTVLGTATRTGAGTFTFPDITYGPEDIGETFTYYVAETDGATANVKDTEYKEIKVTVSEGATSLKTVVSGTAVVTNKYTDPAPDTPDATITVEKIASGSKLAGATLKLTYASGSKDLSDVSITDANEVNIASDKYSMTWVTSNKTVTLEDLHPGEYVLSEVEAPNGYKLADDIMFKVVPPADPQSGEAVVYLMVDGNYETTPVTSITMTDEVKTGSVTIKGTKIVSGDPIDEEFKFVLTDANGNEKVDTTNGAGTFEFKVEYSAPGTYTYTVAEVAGTTSGMTYDTTPRTVTVTVADNGGENLEAVVSGDLTITNKYKKQSTVITPVVDGTDATISKRAISADGAEVPGASMKLSYTGTFDLRHVTHSNTDGLAIEIIDNNKAITWTSGKNALELKSLPDGEYVLTETAAPAGYEYASDMKFKIESGKVYQALPTGGYSTSANPTIVMVDEAKGGSITLTGTKKITGDSAASAPAEKFNFVVMEGDTQVATGTANGAGKITFTEIKYEGATGVGKHTYTITEKAGTTENMFYSKAELKVVVNVTDDGVKGSKLKAEIVAAESDAIEFTNKYTVPGNLIVTVYDEITKDIVPNADVEITNPQGEKTTYKTDENGQIKLDKIEPGDYYIETVKVPEGYTVSLGKTETATVVSKETTEHDVYITIPGKLIVTVYDEKTGDVVPDATVEITTPDGTKKEYKTDENGKIVIDNAQPGDYVVETVEVPSGYEVTLGKKETATVVSKKETEHDVYIDISTPGNLIVTVYDEKTGDVVPNATVEITDYTGETKEYTTDKDGKITVNGLTPGKYDIETTKVPEGYDVTLGKTETAMVEPGKTTSHDVYIGKEILGNLIVTVYDEKTKEVVPGATIKVTAPDGTSKEYTTNKNGKVTLNEIAAGDYKIETIKVPEGYTVTIGKVETATVVAGKTASHDVYINTKSATTTDTTDKTDKTDSHVKTGDTANLKLTFVLMFVSVVGAVYVLSMKKKRC